jgi:hypothetical protein
MFFIVALCAVAALVWWFLAPGVTFVRRFADLVENPSTTPIAPAFPRFNSTASGQFKGRTVRLTLHHPAKHHPGMGVVEMSTSASGGEPWKDVTLTRENPDIGRATFDLEGKYGLILSLNGGWLRATWTRRGLKFPGAFDEAMWRNTLAQLDAIASWMERRQAG